MNEKDPVCGMLVDPGEAAGTRSFDGRILYFCNSECLAKFDKTPQRYAAAAPLPQDRKG